MLSDTYQDRPASLSESHSGHFEYPSDTEPLVLLYGSNLYGFTSPSSAASDGELLSLIPPDSEVLLLRDNGNKTRRPSEELFLSSLCVHNALSLPIVRVAILARMRLRQSVPPMNDVIGTTCPSAEVARPEMTLTAFLELFQRDITIGIFPSTYTPKNS